MRRDVADIETLTDQELRQVTPQTRCVLHSPPLDRAEPTRWKGKSDLLDAHRIAQETQNHHQLACAFKHRQPSAPDPISEQMALWHNARRSLTRVRVQLLGEIDAMIHDLPEDLRIPASAMKTVRARVHSLDRLSAALDAVENPVVRLRIELIRQRVAMLNDVLEQDRIAGTELERLVRETKSQLCKLVGIAPRSAAEILVEVGDIRRFSEAGFARYTGTAPIPATSGGGGEPVRHRLSRGRKPQAQRHDSPHGHDPAPLRTSGQDALRPRSQQRPHPS